MIYKAFAEIKNDEIILSNLKTKLIQIPGLYTGEENLVVCFVEASNHYERVHYWLKRAIRYGSKFKFEPIIDLNLNDVRRVFSISSGSNILLKSGEIHHCDIDISSDFNETVVDMSEFNYRLTRGHLSDIVTIDKATNYLTIYFKDGFTLKSHYISEPNLTNLGKRLMNEI